MRMGLEEAALSPKWRGQRGPRGAELPATAGHRAESQGRGPALVFQAAPRTRLLLTDLACVWGLPRPVRGRGSGRASALAVSVGTGPFPSSCQGSHRVGGGAGLARTRQTLPWPLTCSEPRFPSVSASWGDEVVTVQSLGRCPAPGPTFPGFLPPPFLCTPPHLPPSPPASHFPSSQGKRSHGLAVHFYFCIFRFLAPRLASAEESSGIHKASWSQGRM